MHRVRIKICGITRAEDALFISKQGVDAIGFVFYEKSKRYITPLDARKIVDTLPPFVSKVGVFVNKEEGLLIDIARYVKLDTIQLHGDEDLNYISNIKRFYPVIKAIPIATEKDISNIEKYKDIHLLFDTKTKGYGGSGKTFPWEILKPYTKELGPFILSGGLNPDNIRSAIETLKPYGVDVSSGVEISPGIKDHEKILRLLEEINKIEGVL